MDKKIYRAIDANISRALEGLRVCEDILRFVMDSRASGEFKEFRHIISAFSRKIPSRFLLNERNVEKDHQKFIDTEGERTRKSPGDILSANLGRAIEAVRALEEFSKLIDNESSSMLQGLRFRLYDFEKEMVLRSAGNESAGRLRNSLYAILDSAFIKEGNYPETAQRLIRGGASVIQLRMKGSPPGEVFSAAEKVSRLCRESGTVFILNDYPDIAYITGAQGVHLGQEDVPVREIRKFLPADVMVGISTHSYDQALRAADDGPDYIAVGPVFDSRSKNGSLMQGIGTGVLSRVCRDIPFPIVAIGGIDVKNILEITGAGCSCCAVISGLYRDGRIEENCRELADALR